MGRCGDGRSPQAVLAHLSSEFTTSLQPPRNWSAPREGPPPPGTGCGLHIPGTCTHLRCPVTRPEVRLVDKAQGDPGEQEEGSALWLSTYLPRS